MERSLHRSKRSKQSPSATPPATPRRGQPPRTPQREQTTFGTDISISTVEPAQASIPPRAYLSNPAPSSGQPVLDFRQRTSSVQAPSTPLQQFTDGSTLWSTGNEESLLSGEPGWQLRTPVQYRLAGDNTPDTRGGQDLQRKEESRQKATLSPHSSKLDHFNP